MNQAPRHEGRAARVVETIFTILIPAFAIWFIWQATMVPEPPRNVVVGPRTFPIIAGVLMIIVSIPLLMQRLRVHRDAASGLGRGGGDDAFVPGEDDEVHVGDRRAVVVVLGALLSLFLLLETLGFVVALSLFVFALATFFSRDRWPRNLAVAVVFALAFYSLFTYVLRIRLPNGILEGYF